MWYAKSQARDQSALRQRIRDIAMNRPRFGYLRVLVMLKREGWQVGKKRVYRLYRLEGLQLRMKVKRRKRIALLRGKVVPATGANEHWSMDFVHDQMHDGRRFRILTVIDQWSRESVSLEANFRLTGRCVGKALDQAAEQRGWPRAITVDNGTEFTSRALDEWAYRRGVKLDYTRPGKPTDNGLIESFNGRLRDEFLNVNEFITMLDVREKLKAWQDDYNHRRPHGSLGNLTPSEFATMRSGQPNQAAALEFKTVRLPGERQPLRSGILGQKALLDQSLCNVVGGRGRGVAHELGVDLDGRHAAMGFVVRPHLRLGFIESRGARHPHRIAGRHLASSGLSWSPRIPLTKNLRRAAELPNAEAKQFRTPEPFAPN